MKAAIASAFAALALLSAFACSHGKPAATPPGAQRAPLAEITITPESQRAAGITVTSAVRRSIPISIRADGVFTVNEHCTEHIGVLFPGSVTQVFANVGDSVRAGQVLALLYSHDLHAAAAAYQSAAAELDRTRRQFTYARTVRDRYRRLYEVQYASREETERTEFQYQSARADRDKAIAIFRAAQAQLAGMLQVPARDLNRLAIDPEAMPIKTPRAGIVIARMVTPGAALQPGQETFTVSDLSSLWMIASVNESDLHEVRAGLSATVRVRAFPDVVFSSWVDQLEPRLDPATRTLSVRLVVPNPEGLLRPEMFGTAEIAKEASRAAIFMPEAAVQDINGNAMVFVRHGAATFEARPVQLGARRRGVIEIRAGLSVGEPVVDHGAFVVKSQFLTRALSQE